MVDPRNQRNVQELGLFLTRQLTPKQQPNHFRVAKVSYQLLDGVSADADVVRTNVGYPR